MKEISPSQTIIVKTSSQSFLEASDDALARWGGDYGRYNSLMKLLTFLLVTQIELVGRHEMQYGRENSLSECVCIT